MFKYYVMVATKVVDQTSFPRSQACLPATSEPKLSSPPATSTAAATKGCCSMRMLFGASCLGVEFRWISPKQQLGRAALCPKPAI